MTGFRDYVMELGRDACFWASPAWYIGILENMKHFEE